MKKHYWTNNYVNYLTAVVLIIYLMSANQIISRWVNREHPLQKADTQSLSDIAAVYYGIDTFNIQNDFFDKIYISGWAFSESSSTQCHNPIRIILKGEKESQIIDTNVSSRSDLYNIFAPRNISIPNSNVGFTVAFSTVGLKSDSYDVFIECCTEGESVGMGETGIKLLKTAEGIERVYSTGELSFDDIKLTDKVRFEIDSIEFDGGLFKVSGWGIMENKKSADLLYYIKIISGDEEKTYPMVKTPRKDISEAYKANNYLLSGFSLETKCSDEIFEDGAIIQLIVETPEHEYLSAFQLKEIFRDSEGKYQIKSQLTN